MNVGYFSFEKDALIYTFDADFRFRHCGLDPQSPRYTVAVGDSGGLGMTVESHGMTAVSLGITPLFRFRLFCVCFW
jgi:hypothetical protein